MVAHHRGNNGAKQKMHHSVEERALVRSTSGVKRDSELIPGDTIAAISTPAGEGAIALVRISDPDAIRIADQIFRGKESPSRFVSHVQHLGEIVTKSGGLIDEVMISVHRAPASYTGEDIVEVSCHGGTLVTAKVLEACLRAGARGARPGEFTERAFLNGKMDLTQAEAVIDLIRAQTELALRAANEQLAGHLGREVSNICESLLTVLAHVEAYIDFPDEEIDPDTGRVLREKVLTLEKRLDRLLATADQGRVLRHGFRAVLYGG